VRSNSRTERVVDLHEAGTLEAVTRSGPKSAAWVANEIPNEHCQSSASGYLDPDKLTAPLRELITLDRTGSTEFAVILIFLQYRALEAGENKLLALNKETINPI